MTLAESEAADAFVETVEALGLPVVERSSRDAVGDLVLDLDGRRVSIQLKRLSTITPGYTSSVLSAQARWTQPGALRVLVADRISEAAREELRTAGWGWLDLRGHLHLAGQGVFVDADVPPLRERPLRSSALAGAVGLEIACSLLLDPDRRHGVRALARELGRSPSTVSEVLRALREQRMIDVDNRPVLPDLFWETAGAWRPREVALAELPRPEDGSMNAALQLGLEDVEGTPGWALTDTLAAAAYGAPIGVRSDYPPDFYVPTQTVLRRAQRLLGVVDDHARRHAAIRAAPVPMVCAQRVDPTDQTADPARWGTTGEHWPLTRPLFVALDMARDPSRGREILDGWDPSKPWRRVW